MLDRRLLCLSCYSSKELIPKSKVSSVIVNGIISFNLLGLKAEDLFPESEIPHFRVSDNVVSGYSRGEKGFVVFENATKTTTQEDEEILLPLIQPSLEIAVEIAKYLKSNYKPKERICPGTPGGVLSCMETDFQGV